MGVDISTLSQQGLFQKYTIGHSDGHPVDPGAQYFVLRYDQDDDWGRVGRETLWAMCQRIEKDFPALAADLREQIRQVGLWRIFTNDVDTFVAVDLDDLPVVFKEHYGESMSSMDEELENWSEIAPDQPITIWCEGDDYKADDPQYPPDAGVTRKPGDCRVYITASGRAWAKANGRGFLCSTEY